MASDGQSLNGFEQQSDSALDKEGKGLFTVKGHLRHKNKIQWQGT